MKPIYCTETQDRIPFEYFSQGKAIWSGGKPYLTRVAMELGLKPDPAPPASFLESQNDSSESGRKVGPPPVKVNAPAMGTSSMEMAAIPSSNPAMAVLPQIPKQEEPPKATPAASQVGAASTVMGPGVPAGEEQPMVSPPPMYVKATRTATSRVPSPPPDDDDKLDPTVPEVNLKQRKVIPSPLEAPTLTPNQAAVALQKPTPQPPPPMDDDEKTPAMTSVTPVPVPPKQEDSKPEAQAGNTPASDAPTPEPQPAENSALSALESELEQAKAVHAKLEADASQAEQAFQAAQTSFNELNRKMLVDSETVEGTLAAAKAREKEEAGYRSRIEELQKIEADAKAQMEAAAKERAELEEKARGIAVARAKADQEIKQRRQAENRLKSDLESRQKAMREAEVCLQAARAESEKAVLRIKAVEDSIAKAIADEAAKKAEVERAAKERAAQVEKARKEAEEKARREAEEKARLEAEEKARKEAEELERAERELKEKLESVQKARREAEERAKRG